MKIDRTVYFDTTGEGIAPLTALPLTELQQMRQESTDAEQTIFESLQQQAKAWEEQAGRSALLRKAIEYVMTPPVKHISNKWEKTDYDWHTRSNAVYQMTYHIYENTRYDRGQQKSVPYSWSCTKERICAGVFFAGRPLFPAPTGRNTARIAGSGSPADRPPSA